MRKQVLVIDDDRGSRDLLRVILELEDCEVTVAENGLVALEKLRSVKPDLILLDILMPGMDGFTFIEELERRELRLAIPILILTANIRAKGRIEQMGFDRYLTKPFDLKRFLVEITKLLYPLQVG